MTRRFFFGTVMLIITAMMPTWALGSDQETAQGIADAIRASGRLKDYSIGVKYENGTATLMGRVANDQQSAAAVEMAEQMPGITAVVNNLEVKPTAKKDFAVEPTAHQSGSSRRTSSRDDMAFGGTNVQAPAPASAYVPEAQAQQAVQQPAARRVSYNAGIGHHHGRNSGGYSSGGNVSGGEVVQSSGNTGAPIPVGVSTQAGGQRVAYDQPNMPCYAWPSYAAHPNYGQVNYPTQYSASAWPYIGPFYPYPQVPLGWRKVTMEWKDGWWWLDFNDTCRHFRCH
jgi:hypothetical protein